MGPGSGFCFATRFNDAYACAELKRCACRRKCLALASSPVNRHSSPNNSSVARKLTSGGKKAGFVGDTGSGKQQCGFSPGKVHAPQRLHAK